MLRAQTGSTLIIWKPTWHESRWLRVVLRPDGLACRSAYARRAVTVREPSFLPGVMTGDRRRGDDAAAGRASRQDRQPV